MTGHESWGLASNPADKSLHLGMLSDCCRGGIGRGQLFLGEQRVEFPMADDMQGLGFPTSLGFGLPMMSIHRFSGHHGAATDGTWSQGLALIRFGLFSHDALF